MVYQIKMSNKDTYIIEEDEYKTLLASEGKGFYYIKALEVSINRSFIVSIVPGNIAKLTCPLGGPSTIADWLKNKANEIKLESDSPESARNKRLVGEFPTKNRA